MREKVKELLEREYPEIDFEGSDALIDDGIIDSLTMTGIISSLSMEFGITISFEDVIPENFNSITSIAKLVENINKGGKK